mgnify:CR=1 FL=1
MCAASNDAGSAASTGGRRRVVLFGKHRLWAEYLDHSTAGQADVLEQIAEPHRDALVALTKRDLDPETLAELDEDVRDDVLEQLDSKEIAAAARELETDDAALHPLTVLEAHRHPIAVLDHMGVGQHQTISLVDEAAAQTTHGALGGRGLHHGQPEELAEQGIE